MFVTIGESERPQISSMHTNRPLFNLPSEGVSLYQSPVIVKFIIPDIALVSHDTTRVADPSVSASLLNPTRAASTYSYSPDRSRGPIPTLALPHLREGMPRSGFSPAALEFTAGPHQGGGGPNGRIHLPPPASRVRTRFPGSRLQHPRPYCTTCRPRPPGSALQRQIADLRDRGCR